ncbi:MAG: hypothetical protein KDC12_06850 [Flavobacteriales bacterium]|nr:hypothetical protein [Flavobacteriales bacterium]
MTGAEWIEMGIFLLMSIVKFLITPSTMIARGWGFFETVLVTSSGAALGSFMFYHLGDLFFKWMQRKRKKPSRLFTWKNRKLARIKSSFGVKGLMLISGLISVPITAVLAARYFRSNTTLPYIIMGFFIWSVVLTSISMGFGHLISIFTE